jgi:hypothetical protein
MDEKNMEWMFSGGNRDKPLPMRFLDRVPFVREKL